LFIKICKQQADIAGQQIIHFVSQSRFAQKLASPHQIAYCHMEVSVSAAPVRYLGELMADENVLSLWMN